MTSNRTVLILILGLLSAIGPFSIDTYLAGFPAIANDLHTTVYEVSYTLSSFFIGISIGQMIYGPLLDRFGRKKPLMIGLVIYVIASLACTFATTIEMLIGLRFLQALGGCVGMVASRAIVRDIFPVHEIAKIFSLLVLILGVSPIIAPSIGSILIAKYGWHSVFELQSFMVFLLLIAVYFYLPESKQPDTSMSLKPKPIINGFLFVVKNPTFFTYAFTGSIVSAGIYAYVSGAPSVFMKIFNVSEQEFGYIFSFLASGLIFSSQLNRWVLRKYNSMQIINTTLWVQIGIGLLLCVGSLFGWLTLYSIIALSFLFLSCQGFIQPNATALSLAPFSKEAGSASALIGALQMGFGALGAALVGFLSDGTSLPMIGVMVGCSIFGMVILGIGHLFLIKRVALTVEE